MPRRNTGAIANLKAMQSSAQTSVALAWQAGYTTFFLSGSGYDQGLTSYVSKKAYSEMR